ncbi:MAG: HupE/UreJ family protein [Sinimarinibacterium sp.]
MLTTSLLASTSALAHEFRTSFLVIQSSDGLHHRLSWRLHIKDADSASGDWVAGPGCTLVLLGTSRSASVEQRDYTLSCAQAPARISAPLLEGVPFDVLVKIVSPDGVARFDHLDASRRDLSIEAAETQGGARSDLLVDGVTHVLGGPDHLAYILLLFTFLRRRPSSLYFGITLFTVAHSLTLALSVLGSLRVAPAPVEAVIALTIAYFASAIARGRRVGTQSSLPAWPAMVVVCGLVHGLGFANSLATVGLSGTYLAWSLVSFNIGIELAQITVVLLAECVLSVFSAFNRQDRFVPANYPVGVGAGALAIFWYLDRLV